MSVETRPVPAAAPQPAPPATAPGSARRPPRPGRAFTAFGLGTSVLYLSLVVLVPLAFVVWRSTGQGPGRFWAAVTAPDALAALKLTVVASAIVAVVNLLMGTVIAWVLVRDDLPGKGLVDML